jgi:hypothetical protein
MTRKLVVVKRRSSLASVADPRGEPDVYADETLSGSIGGVGGVARDSVFGTECVRLLFLSAVWLLIRLCTACISMDESDARGCFGINWR